VVSSRAFFDEDFNLYLVRGTLRQRLTDHVGDEVGPEFSPTADRILFLQLTASGRSLRILDRATRQESPLPVTLVDRAVWSPDGTRIAFVQGGRIRRINSDGSGEAQLTSGPDDRDPYWSPDGTRLAFTRGRAVYVVNADGSGLRAVSVDKRLAGPWSPDGRSLAVTIVEEVCSYYSYYCYYYGPTLMATDLVRLDVETGQEVLLTQNPGVAKWSPAWSADGQRLYYISAGAGNSDVYVVTANGGAPSNLTNSQEQESWVSVGLVQAGSVSASRAGLRSR
jgi:Tol biopolymer transport system component